MNQTGLGFCPSSHVAEPIFEQIFNGYLTAVLVAFGLCINICSILILRSLRKRSGSIQNYLIALAVWDNILLLAAFMMYCLSTLIYGRRVWFGNFVYVYPIAYTLSPIALMGTLWNIVVLTIDRYRFVLYPIQFRPTQSGRHRCTSIAICIISAIAIILGIPSFMEIRIAYCQVQDSTNKLLPVVATTKLRSNYYYQVFFKIIGGLCFQNVGPVVLIAFLMSRISVELYRARKRRRRMSFTPAPPINVGAKRGKKKKIDNSDNLMLFCVVLKFLLTRSLPLALDVCEILLGNAFNQHWFIQNVVTVSNFMVVFNSATNFFLYIVVGFRFRQRCQLYIRRLLCCGYRSPIRSSITDQYDTSVTTHETTKQDLLVSVRADGDTTSKSAVTLALLQTLDRERLMTEGRAQNLKQHRNHRNHHQYNSSENNCHHASSTSNISLMTPESSPSPRSSRTVGVEHEGRTRKRFNSLSPISTIPSSPAPPQPFRYSGSGDIV